MLRGSLVLETADLARTSNEDLRGVLGAVLRASSRGGVLYVTDSVFTVNASKGEKTFRISVGRGSIVVPYRQAWEAWIEDLCVVGGGNLCWELMEDVWGDVMVIRPSIGFDERSPCPKIYLEAVAEMGLEPSSDPRALIVCREGGVGLEEAACEGRPPKIVIPTYTGDVPWKEIRVEAARGFRHPLAAILGGRIVRCRPLAVMGGTCPGAEILVRGVLGSPLIYGRGDDTCVLACQPDPKDLMFAATLVYALSERRPRGSAL